jgi:hypothetical protein
MTFRIHCTKPSIIKKVVEIRHRHLKLPLVDLGSAPRALHTTGEPVPMSPERL